MFIDIGLVYGIPIFIFFFFNNFVLNIDCEMCHDYTRNKHLKKRVTIEEKKNFILRYFKRFKNVAFCVIPV